MSIEILKKYKIKAKKALGQNFLVNEEIVQEIADIIKVEWKHIIEVGPWYGALTEKLVSKNPKSLNLVELDQDMIDILDDRISQWDLDTSHIEFRIHKQDVLKYQPDTNQYSVVANIPYYITSPILRHFLYDVDQKPDDMVILMQKDVADKILGWKNNKSSVISLLVEKKATPYFSIFVGRDNFVPAPKVESAVVLFESHDLYTGIWDEKFLKIIKMWFVSVRKKLIRNFMNGWYEKAEILSLFHELNIDQWVRWEDLSIEQWVELVSKMRVL